MKNTTTKYEVTVGSSYVSIYVAGERNGRHNSPIAFYEVPKDATSPAAAVATVLRWYFGKGAGTFRVAGDACKLPSETYTRLGLTRETVPVGEVSVLVPHYLATIDLEKAEGRYRIYHPRAA